MPSNRDNQINHLVSLLSQRLDRQPACGALPAHGGFGGGFGSALEAAVSELHEAMLGTYQGWVKHTGLKASVVMGLQRKQATVGSLSLPFAAGAQASSGASAGERRCLCNLQLHRMMLFMLLWGEAANLRHLPECLCFVFYCAANVLLVDMPAPDNVEPASVGSGARYSLGPAAKLGPTVRAVSLAHPGYLEAVVCPFYELLASEISKRRDEPISERAMYDDINEVGGRAGTSNPTHSILLLCLTSIIHLLFDYSRARCLACAFPSAAVLLGRRRPPSAAACTRPVGQVYGRDERVRGAADAPFGSSARPKPRRGVARQSQRGNGR